MLPNYQDVNYNPADSRVFGLGFGRPGFGFGRPGFGWGRPGFGWGFPGFGFGFGFPFLTGLAAGALLAPPRYYYPPYPYPYPYYW